LIALVNTKLKLNKDRLQAFLDAVAKDRVFPNYHDKVEILECLDHADERRFRRWLKKTRYKQALFTYFDPVPPAESVRRLHDLLSTGKVNRSDARACPLSERQTEILRSLFGSYVFLRDALCGFVRDVWPPVEPLRPGRPDRPVPRRR
jgi:hypothetical protein